MSIPEFPEAIDRFKRFLVARSSPADLAWVFREDLYSPSGRYRVHYPVPADNLALAAWAYGEGRSCGTVRLDAVCRVGLVTAATEWFPVTPEHLVQGMPEGLALSVRTLITQGTPVRSHLAWRFRERLVAYKEYQAYALFVLSRMQLAAQQRRAADSGRAAS